MALGGAPRNKHIEAIQIAQIINRYSGAAIVAPWELDALPDEWVQTYIKLAVEYPKMKAGIDENKKIMAKIRAKHARDHNVRYSN